MNLTQLVARPDARAALEAWIRESGTLTDAAASHAGVELLQGRGRVHVVPAPVGDGHWVVRHYQRGGAVASWLGDRYLRVGVPRPVREFGVGRTLQALSVPTPSHVGGAVYPGGVWYRGDLVTELVPASRDLAAVLFGAGRRDVDAEAAMHAAGALVRLLHERGVVHRDLNLKNVLIADGGSRPDAGGPPVRALVLDLDRASVRSRVGERARRRMLDRFWRSARKWEDATGESLAPGLRRSFEAGYQRGSGIEHRASGIDHRAAGRND